MRKDIRNKKPGFTIAELLISMLIVMLIAAAMVPVIGPKKLKRPFYKQYHGVAECYYKEGDSKIQYYSADNKGFVETRREQGEYCEFDVPKADRYDIYAIGAGSDGSWAYPSSNPLPISLITLTEDDIIVNGDSNSVESDFGKFDRFEINFKNAPLSLDENGNILGIGKPPASFFNELKDAFDGWAEQLQGKNSDLYFKLENIYSPTHGGGAASSKLFRRGSNEIYEDLCTDPNNNENLCKEPSNFEYKHAAGGNSGYKTVLIDYPTLVPIDGSSIITDMNKGYDTTSLHFEMSYKGGGKNKLILSSAQKGPDGYWEKDSNNVWKSVTPTDIPNASSASVEYDAQRCIKYNKECLTAGKIHAIRNGKEKSTQGDKEGIMSFPDEGSSEPIPESGNIVYNKKPFHWSYSSVGMANYKYGLPGKPGEVRSAVYPQLKVDKLYLFPGKTYFTNTYVSLGTDTSIKSNILIEAKSMPNEGYKWVDYGPVPIGPYPPQDVLKATTVDNSSLMPYISKLNTYAQYGIKKGLYNCDQQEIGCPGFGSSGIYPLIVVPTDQSNEFKNKYLLNLHDNQGLEKNDYSVGYGGTPPKEEDVYRSNGSGEIKCHDGSTPLGVTNKKYCQKHFGNGGAVIILW